MAELTPLERLQPCLLDRLTDDDPGQREESRTSRVVSLQRYRRGVLRDLTWLFNSTAHLPTERLGSRQIRLADFPHALRSVINFGTRQLAGVVAPDMLELQQQLTEAIRFFEPRLLPRTVEIHADFERNTVTFELRGDLWANPIPDHLFLKSTVDLETEQCLVREADHG